MTERAAKPTGGDGDCGGCCGDDGGCGGDCCGDGDAGRLDA